MGDYLEKLAQEQRSQFDSDYPSDDVWSAIDKGLASDQKGTWKQGLWKYAAVLFLISTVALMVDRISRTDAQPQVVTEFEQVESYYTQLIEDKRAQLAQYESEALEESFRNDLEQLDELYGELKDQFENDIRDPKVRDAMIINLKIRLDILSRQIEILEKLNTEDDESEATDFS